MKKYIIKGLTICFLTFNYLIGNTQTHENKVTCEQIKKVSMTSFWKEVDIRNGLVYTYKDMTMYMLYTNIWLVHWRNAGEAKAANEAPPVHVVRPFYFFLKKNCDTMYEFSDSLKTMQIFPTTKFDSLLDNKSLALSMYKSGFSDTSHFKIEKVKKRRKRTILTVNFIDYHFQISKDNYIKVYLSKRKLYLHHQIAPDLDSIYGMRTYRVEFKNKLPKLEEHKNVKSFPFFRSTFTLKKYKISSERKAEVIDLFDSCLVKSANPANAIRNWFPKGASISK